MKSCVILAFIAVAFAAPSNEFSEETEFIQGDDSEGMPPAQTLMDAVHELRGAAPELLQAHVDHVTRHANLIQSMDLSGKAKAYAHNFAASQKAITAALNSLIEELKKGHNHDKNALNTARNQAHRLLASTKSNCKSKVNGYRKKACPSKRSEEAADRKKGDALKKLNHEKNTKICNLGTTWDDMDIDKSTPKFGTTLRNGWDKARARWLRAKRSYDAAVKAHQNAIANHNKAMASFKTALKIEAENTRRQCLNGHKEYNVLKNEVAANVRTRKATFIATLVIKCYIDNVTSNSKAKACADGKRKATTSMWDINPPALNGCSSAAHLQNSFGPASWQPTVHNCKRA